MSTEANTPETEPETGSATPLTPDEEAPSSTGRSIIRFDPLYVTSFRGLVKVTEAVVSLLGFICVQTIRTSVYRSAGGWYAFVSLPAFMISTLFILFYIFHIVEKFKGFPWLLVEMGYAIAWCIMFFIAASVAATRIRADPPWGAAAFFGFIAMTVFGYESFMKYLQWHKEEPAQKSKENDEEAAVESEGNTAL